MKHTTMIWKGLARTSIEKCSVVADDKRININSIITGQLREGSFQVAYFIQTDNNWNILGFHLESEVNQVKNTIHGERTADSQWTINEDERADLAFHTDIDISLSPFTNSLPINRLHFNIGEKHQINVVYINVLENEITGVKQIYTRLTETQYQYQNLRSNYETIIEVNSSGFVVNYPDLFKMTSLAESSSLG